jgi:hypothetical protein
MCKVPRDACREEYLRVLDASGDVEAYLVKQLLLRLLRLEREDRAGPRVKATGHVTVCRRKAPSPHAHALAV